MEESIEQAATSSNLQVTSGEASLDNHLAQDIIIVGSGASGCTTALMLRAYFPQLPIAIITPKDGKIIGVGEGTTEHWSHSFAKAINVDMVEFIKNCGATLKLGVDFDGWKSFRHKKNNRYFHSLISEWHDDTTAGIPVALNIVFGENDPPEDLFPRHLQKGLGTPDTRPNQLHFDAHKLNKYLLALCKERRILIINDEIVDIERSPESGFISGIMGKSKRQYHAELFIDCTGLARVLSKKMEQEFVGLKDQFPLDRAIPFKTPNTKNDFSMFTRAVNMPNGWMWEIPTQTDMGRGYVYCSDFCSDEQAVEDIKKKFKKYKGVNGGIEEKLLDETLDSPRVISFESGHLRKYWYKNLVSIGLSANFFEPMEATNITCGIEQTKILTRYLDVYLQGDSVKLTYLPKRFNEDIQHLVNNFSDFIHLHYMCANNDTEFWKYNMSKPIPENLKNYIDLAKLGALRSDHLSEYPTTVMFSVLSFNQVLYGLGHIEPDLCKKTLLNRMNPEDIINRNIWGRIKLTPLQEELKPHREILDFIVQQGTFEWAQDKADQKKQAENSQ
tara:strand:- start:4259 stop:5932 length:1674 start_codon:yes stop_codon:yes gene_type:complete